MRHHYDTTMTPLFLKIEAATTLEDDILDFCGTICELAEKHTSAISTLLDALIYAVEEKERQWREIEQREDYQARYKNRVEARRDFIRAFFQKKEDIK